MKKLLITILLYPTLISAQTAYMRDVVLPIVSTSTGNNMDFKEDGKVKLNGVLQPNSKYELVDDVYTIYDNGVMVAQLEHACTYRSEIQNKMSKKEWEKVSSYYDCPCFFNIKTGEKWIVIKDDSKNRRLSMWEQNHK